MGRDCPIWRSGHFHRERRERLTSTFFEIGADVHTETPTTPVISGMLCGNLRGSNRIGQQSRSIGRVLSRPSHGPLAVSQPLERADERGPIDACIREGAGYGAEVRAKDSHERVGDGEALALGLDARRAAVDRLVDRVDDDHRATDLELAVARRPTPRFDRTMHDDFEFSADPARLDLDRVHVWLADESYWAMGRSRAALEAAVAASRNYGIYDAESGAQLAYARVITDGVTFAWLCDVFVDAAARGRGIGVALIEQIMASLEPLGLRRIGLTTADAHGLYERFGFRPLDRPEQWMARMSTITVE